MSTSASTKSQFATLVTVFFFWGFLAASNGVFIPFCKEHFSLTQFQSQLIDLAFYLAYFVGSLFLYLTERLMKIDFLNKIGYKMGIAYGLFISAAGAIAMIGAVNIGNYWLILSALFLIAIGFSLQQTCAQPFAIALGNPETGAHRLNLAGGINSFGTTIGPLIVSYFLFGGLTRNVQVEISSVNQMYVFLAGLFIAVAVFFIFSNLPKITQDEHIEAGRGALKYPQLVFGMIGIFVYVGVEVTIQSNLGALLKLPEFGGYDESEISHFISLFWGSLMIGRWTGAITVFNLPKLWKNILTVVVPYIAFAVVLGANKLGGTDVSDLYVYAFVIAIQVVGFFIGQEKPAKTLLTFSMLGMAAMMVGMLTTGKIAIFAFVSGGLFCSVMWPCIFSLSVAGLGKYTSHGSTFLIMMILGGALIPPFQGWLADVMNDIHMSYFITVFLFGYLAYFAIKAKKVLKAQGIDYETSASTAH
ncbi:MAG: MFS transporter [Ignavibacteriales bacterium]|nr:MFS transporter [Ignavibacteriales bacterium]